MFLTTWVSAVAFIRRYIVVIRAILMPDSDITCSALAATSGIGQIELTWTVTDPNTNKLNYLKLDTVELWAATTNDRAVASKVREGVAGAVHTGLVRGSTWYYWVKAKNRSGRYGDWFPSGATSGVTATEGSPAASATAYAANSNYVLVNGYIAASVAANALTVAVKTLAGTDPSAADPVSCSFLSATVGSAAPVVRQITAALSLTISAGSTLGPQSANIPFRIWVVLFDDAGTLRLAVTNKSNPANGIVYPLVESGVASAVQDAGGASDAVNVLYAAATITAKAFRIIGYMEWSSGLATPGTWSTAPDVVRMAVPGMAPGKIAQDYTIVDRTYGGTTTATIPYDNTIPQISEGAAWFGVSLQPQSACNFFDFDISLPFSCSAISEFMLTLFKDSAAGAIAVSWAYASAIDIPCELNFRHRRQAGTTAAVLFDFRRGSGQACTTTYNGVAGAAKFGGAGLVIYVRIAEVFG